MEQINCQIEEIIEYEGGYVNDPDDRGGPTNFGITQETLSKWRNKEVTPAEVQALEHSEAVCIYKKMYYLDTRICDLHVAIQTPVLDMCIHSGSTAIRLLQETLLKAGYTLVKDGIAGPETFRISSDAYEDMGLLLMDAYGLERIDYYYSLGDNRVQSRKYVKTRLGGKGGWIRRAERFMSDEYHITEEEHRARVASWG